MVPGPVRVLDLEDGARIVIVGHGQLGSAVAHAVKLRWLVDEGSHAIDWSSPAVAARSVAVGLEGLSVADTPVTVVWAAGRCGMSSTAAECQQSLGVMAAVLEELRALRPQQIHLMGSVGALALGHPRWSTAGEIVDSLPYARLKRDEEALVNELELGRANVHLVSSVFGPPDRPGRRGMITVLAVNATQLRTTRIFGKWSTLRNYVHADDVAAFVVERIARGDGPGRYVLASPRSHSISELVLAVSNARRRAVPVHLVQADNADDLTIDPGCIAPGFRPRPLETAVRQMVLDLRHVSVA